MAVANSPTERSSALSANGNVSSSAKEITKQLSKKQAWMDMSDKRASLARMDSFDLRDEDNPEELSSSISGGASPIYFSESCPPILKSTLDAILSPPRLAALEACDVAPVPYQPYNFFSYMMTFHGRNFHMIVSPLLCLFIWGLGWQLLFVYGTEDGSKFGTSYGEAFGIPVSDAQHAIASLETLVDPLMTPISFLLTFRLGRAAVRYWDARQASGKLVELVRAHIATISVGIVSPIRWRRAHLERKRRKLAALEQIDSDYGHKEGKSSDLGDGSLESLEIKQTKNAIYKLEDSSQDEVALELLCSYAKWLAAFAVAVKHFLRPERRKNWDNATYHKKRRYEFGALLTDNEARNVLMEYDDEKGKLAWGPDDGSGSLTRARDSPLVTLGRLQEMAYDIAYFDHSGPATPQAQAALYQQINTQINGLYGAYGAMERIKGTPLPFVYAIHLRTFLVLYLILWNMTSVAHYGWIALPCLFAFNWSLLGIEAAAVECERPFDWNRNHLTLGKFAAVSAKNIGEMLKEVRW